MHALDLVRPDNGILQCSALLDDEDSVAFPALALSGTFHAPAEGLHSAVVGFAFGYFVRLVEGGAALGGGEREGISHRGGGEEREDEAFLVHVDDGKGMK